MLLAGHVVESPSVHVALRFKVREVEANSLGKVLAWLLFGQIFYGNFDEVAAGDRIIVKYSTLDDLLALISVILDNFALKRFLFLSATPRDDPVKDLRFVPVIVIVRDWHRYCYTLTCILVGKLPLQGQKLVGVNE